MQLSEVEPAVGAERELRGQADLRSDRELPPTRIVVQSFSPAIFVEGFACFEDFVGPRRRVDLCESRDPFKFRPFRTAPLTKMHKSKASKRRTARG